MKGFVYAMSNPAYDSLKIGKSDRDPTIFRAQELDTTGVPEPFTVEYLAFVEDPGGVEKSAHDLLDKFRVRPNREFFRCGLVVAIDAIRKAAGDDLKYEELLGNDASTLDTDFASKGDNKSRTTLEKGYFGTKVERMIFDPTERINRWDGPCMKCKRRFKVTVIESSTSAGVAVCPVCFFENETNFGEI